MATTKQMIEQAQNAKRKAAASGEAILVPKIAPLHSQWMERSEEDQAFTPEAIQRGIEVLSNRHKVKRSERFSASGLGMCPRRQLFSFAGYPQEPTNLDSSDLMRSGTAAHFWIMLEGLSAGWLIEAEVFYRDEHYRVGGTLDGIISDASIWEYKSVASTVYDRVTTKKGSQFAVGDKTPEVGPKYEHELQLEAYELLTGMPLKSLFYQNRNFGQYYEYRLGPNGERQEQLTKLLTKLNSHENDNTLPPMLDVCESRSGDIYNQCPYRVACPGRKKLYD